LKSSNPDVSTSVPQNNFPKGTTHAIRARLKINPTVETTNHKSADKLALLMGHYKMCIYMCVHVCMCMCVNLLQSFHSYILLGPVSEVELVWCCQE